MQFEKDSISKFEFPVFNSGPSNSKEKKFKFKEIQKISSESLGLIQEKLKIERDFANESEFKISPVVREHRGLKALEEEERERKIQEEVAKRVKKIEESSFKKGLEEGRKAGEEEVFNETRTMTEEKLARFTEMINYVLGTGEEIITQQKTEIYILLRNLTKWIILRELKEDGAYIERLLEKLIQEMQVRSNILIKVNKNSFEGMEEIFETVQKKIGKINNARIEVDYDVDQNGLIVEAENGIIDGRLDEQFSRLDQLFKGVGINDEL